MRAITTLSALLLALALSLNACGGEEKPANEPASEMTADSKAGTAASTFKIDPAVHVDSVAGFRKLLDSAGVTGNILVYDSRDGKFYSNDFNRCAQSWLPASTFKIVNTMIGLETGELKNKHDLFNWDSIPRRMDAWNRDLRLIEAYQVSCVPCYQELARRIGPERMNAWLDSIDYPGMDVNSETIDSFWLEGKSRISSLQQLDFVHRLLKQELPLSDKTYKELRDIMLLGESNGLRLSGKTGWSIRDDFNIGWFVGMVEGPDSYACVVVNIEPTERIEPDNFPMVRQKLAMQALRQVGFNL